MTPQGVSGSKATAGNEADCDIGSTLGGFAWQEKSVGGHPCRPLVEERIDLADQITPERSRIGGASGARRVAGATGPAIVSGYFADILIG